MQHRASGRVYSRWARLPPEVEEERSRPEYTVLIHATLALEIEVGVVPVGPHAAVTGRGGIAAVRAAFILLPLLGVTGARTTEVSCGVTGGTARRASTGFLGG